MSVRVGSCRLKSASVLRLPIFQKSRCISDTMKRRDAIHQLFAACEGRQANGMGTTQPTHYEGASPSGALTETIGSLGANDRIRVAWGRHEKASHQRRPILQFSASRIFPFTGPLPGSTGFCWVLPGRCRVFGHHFRVFGDTFRVNSGSINFAQQPSHRFVATLGLGQSPGD